MAVAKAPATDTLTLTKSFYSPIEVARLASVSNSTILNYIRSEKLAAVRLSARLPDPAQVGNAAPRAANKADGLHQ